MERSEYCEICGVEKSHYRCPSCGRVVCREHFELGEKVCVECYEIRKDVTIENVGSIMVAGVLAIIAILLLFIGFTFLLDTIPSGSIVVFFPFIIISDKSMGMVVAIAYAFILLIIMVLFIRYFLRNIVA